jgi:hypothetical protein
VGNLSGVYAFYQGRIDGDLLVAADTGCFTQVSMELEHMLRPGPLVQVIDILSDYRVQVAISFQLCQGKVGRIWHGCDQCVDHRPDPVVEVVGIQSK